MRPSLKQVVFIGLAGSLYALSALEQMQGVASELRVLAALATGIAVPMQSGKKK